MQFPGEEEEEAKGEEEEEEKHRSHEKDGQMATGNQALGGVSRVGAGIKQKTSHHFGD